MGQSSESPSLKGDLPPPRVNMIVCYQHYVRRCTFAVACTEKMAIISSSFGPAVSYYHFTSKDALTCLFRLFLLKQGNPAFSYRTGFHCNIAVLSLCHCFYCTAVSEKVFTASLKLLLLLRCFYCITIIDNIYCIFVVFTV